MTMTTDKKHFQGKFERPVTTAKNTTPRTTVAVFDTLPDSGLVRLAGLIQTPKAPGNPLPFSATTLWRYVKNGTCPACVKLGAKTTAWRVADVRAWLAAQ